MSMPFLSIGSGFLMLKTHRTSFWWLTLRPHFAPFLRYLVSAKLADSMVAIAVHFVLAAVVAVTTFVAWKVRGGE